MVRRNIHKIINDFQQKNPYLSSEAYQDRLKHIQQMKEESEFDFSSYPFPFFSSVKNHKKDFIVILIYYLVFASYELIKTGSVCLSTAIFIGFGGMMFILSISVAIFLFPFTETFVRLETGHCTDAEQKKVIRKEIKKRPAQVAFRVWVFLWKLVVNILTFSFLFKIPFKGKGGSFGGGGASGKI